MARWSIYSHKAALTYLLKIVFIWYCNYFFSLFSACSILFLIVELAFRFKDFWKVFLCEYSFVSEEFCRERFAIITVAFFHWLFIEYFTVLLLLGLLLRIILSIFMNFLINRLNFIATAKLQLPIVIIIIIFFKMILSWIKEIFTMK